jgi:hypothetical protein
MSNNQHARVRTCVCACCFWPLLPMLTHFRGAGNMFGWFVARAHQSPFGAVLLKHSKAAYMLIHSKHAHSCLTSMPRPARTHLCTSPRAVTRAHMHTLSCRQMHELRVARARACTAALTHTHAFLLANRSVSCLSACSSSPGPASRGRVRMRSSRAACTLPWCAGGVRRACRDLANLWAATDRCRRQSAEHHAETGKPSCHTMAGAET